jgi:heterotetrameric sarcosine oxidase alpha subunit
LTHRLLSGGRIDRQRPIDFVFDGRPYRGYSGDTLASALLGQGVRLFGRSFKYHRPRGLLSAGPEEPNALVELREGARREPNTRATQVELFSGLVAQSQNRWPSLAFDLRAVYGWAAPVLKAGFYYKTFMWPARFWEKLYEPAIRKAAGLGRASGMEDPDHYEKATLHCDLLVIGSGPAGLAAALRAARSGARVVVCEQDFDLGGRLLSDKSEIDGRPALDWRDETVRELASHRDAFLLTRTTVFAAYDSSQFAAIERVWDHVIEPPEHEPRQRLWRIVARSSILASGAIERPLVFDGNDRPGIMLSASVRSYLNRYAVLAGRKAVVFAVHDDAAQTVIDLHQAGANVVAVIDGRPDGSDALKAAAALAGAPIYAGSAVREARGGRSGVRSVVLGGRADGEAIDCDLVAMSGGWTPSFDLTSHLGHKPRWNAAAGRFEPTTLPERMELAGSVNGATSLLECLKQGIDAAARVLKAIGIEPVGLNVPEADRHGAEGSPLWRVASAGRKAFVDFQHDVTVSDLVVARDEGYRRVEHLKRYTTLGMATDQGKTSNLNAIGIMAELCETEPSSIGTTTFRPPYTPVALAAFAGHARGRRFRPTRLAPTHAWSRQRGAVFTEAGPWLRAQYYPQAGETDWLQAAMREARTVRDRVGFCDVSTLGKIELYGPDTGAFLDLVYTNVFSSLAVGKVRYGVMLREDGVVLDDGTCARLSDKRWIMSTTTSNAARVLQHLEYCAQIHRPDMNVRFASVTDQWAQVALAGPRSREVLQRVVDDPDAVSAVALPYMGVAEVTLKGGVRARVFRISFSGELGFEIAVPARWGGALMALLDQAGHDFGIEPYGTEALTILRIEKGHVAGGELNGQTSARDLGLGRMLSAKKDFIGRALSFREAFIAPERPLLVGFECEDPTRRPHAGAHLFEPDTPRDIDHDLGYLTSVAYSPERGRWIALGLLSGAEARIGQKITAHDPLRGDDLNLTVCPACFVDPEGVRVRG